MSAIADRVTSNIPGAVSVRATYGGNTIGGGLLEVADETQAYIGDAWVVQARREAFSYYDAGIFEFGRNDASGIESATEYGRAFDKLISQALGKFSKVVTCNCPPRSLVDFSNWDSALDTFETLGHRAQLATAVAKYNQRHYDLYSDFLAKVPATYLIYQLMRDAYHPTNAAGANVIGDAIAAKLNDATPPNSAAPIIAGRVVNYLFGQPTAGSWSTKPATQNFDAGNALALLPRIANLEDQGISAEATGAKVSFPTVTVNQNAQVWAHVFMRNGTGGIVDFYIDRGTGNEIKVTKNTSWIYEHYPQSVLVGGSLAAGSHTIEAETTTSNRTTVIGVTVAGV